ncbi:unnamed protein product [Amoebophrya sp. A120]|nr:unnamed protein product [Amoebophrya sp. A120]|eukprot:GSA120T00000889001.1
MSTAESPPHRRETSSHGGAPENIGAARRPPVPGGPDIALRSPAVGSGTRPAKHISTRGLFAFCFWCAVCGGSIYAFGSFAVELKQRCQNWGVAQTNLIYSLGQFGNSGLGLLVALLYRYSERGARNCMVYAVTCILAGTFLFLFGVRCLTTNHRATTTGAGASTPPDSATPGLFTIELLRYYVFGAGGDDTTGDLDLPSSARSSHFKPVADDHPEDSSGSPAHPIPRWGTAPEVEQLAADPESDTALSATLNDLFGQSQQCTCAENSWVAAVGYFLIQQGGCAIYQCGLFYQLGQAKPERAAMLSGLITSGNGLSAFIWSLYFNFVCFQSTFAFFVSTAALWIGTALLGLVRVFQSAEERRNNGSSGGSPSPAFQEPESNTRISVPATTFSITPTGRTSLSSSSASVHNRQLGTAAAEHHAADGSEDSTTRPEKNHVVHDRNGSSNVFNQRNSTNEERLYADVRNFDGAPPPEEDVQNTRSSSSSAVTTGSGVPLDAADVENYNYNPATLQFRSTSGTLSAVPPPPVPLYTSSSDEQRLTTGNSSPKSIAAFSSEDMGGGSGNTAYTVPLLQKEHQPLPRHHSDSFYAQHLLKQSTSAHLLPPVPEDFCRQTSDPTEVFSSYPQQVVRRRAISMELPRQQSEGLFKAIARESLARLVEVSPLEDALVVRRRGSAPSRPLEVSTTEMLSSVCYWCVAGQFALLQGVCSGFFLANGDNLALVYHYDEDVAQLLQAQSLVNSAARIFFGFLMQAGMRSEWRVEFARHLLLTMLACYLSLLFVETRPLLSFSFLGIGFGGNWAILPAILTSWYGRGNVAVGFNVACLVFVLLGNLLAALFVYVDRVKSIEAGVGLMHKGSLALVGCSAALGAVLVRLRPCRTQDGQTLTTVRVPSCART